MISRMRVIKYSHGMKVIPGNTQQKKVLLDYCRTLAQWEIVREPPQWRPVRQMKRVFAGATKDRRVFHFHINLFDELIKHLTYSGVHKTHIDVEKKPLQEGVDVDFTMKVDMTPYDYQEPIIEFFEQTSPIIKVTNLQTGKGKLQSLDSMIKVPGGWKRMGDMSVGQEVIAWDGTTTRVNGVFPQGKKQMYRVTFWDGRSTLAGAEHLWRVYYVNTVKHRRWRTVDTLEMLRLISMPNPRVYVPLCEPEQNGDVDLSIPPYTLGVILGDGGISGGTINITKMDDEIFKNIESEFPDNLKFKARDHKTRAIIMEDRSKGNPYVEYLKCVGLMGKCSHAKFIPDEYKHGSPSQRLELVRGLMDTDGTVNVTTAGGAISYSTTSLHLAADVQYLIRSLGGIASISERNPSYTYRGEKLKGRKAYQVNIRFKKQSDLFKLTRKRDRTNDENQYAEGLKLRVKSIEPTTVEEAQCISVEHPDHLYVTDDFIVTHNTAVALMTMFRRKKRTLIQLRGGYISRWLTDLDGEKALFKFKKGDIVIVRGRDHLLSVINQAKAGDFDPKVVIISNKTLFGLFKEYELNGKDNLYGISPEELCPLLGIGLRIIDEVHEDYHLSFRSDIYCHCPSSIHLSATLITEDPFRRRMYDIALPKDNWYTGVDYDAYIDVKSIMFDTHEPDKLRTTERGRDMYSHGAYEKSIIRNKKMLANYLDIIDHVVYTDYILEWQGGQKCLVFCSLTDMCVLVRDKLRGRYPELEINEFISETDEVILEKSDIIVSTVESCGTAQDIPGLKMSLLTRALKKLETNEQVKGRLRKLKKWPDITPIFNYLTNRSVPKHLEYHQAKIEQFEGKVKSHKEISIPLKL